MIKFLGIILILCIVFVGGERGVTSLITLAGNLIVLCIAIWLMSIGKSVLLITLLAGIVISCITLFYQNGKNKKTWAAFCAIVITMCIQFFVIYIMVWKSGAGGLNEIQARGEDILYYNLNIGVSMQKITISVILLSTLGTVIDSALTVTSSVYEVKRHNPDRKNQNLIVSGMRVGGNVMGTTVNTLLFAYAGESLLLLSYLKNQKYSFELLINSKMLFQSCAVMIFGAIASVIVIPLAAVIMTKLDEKEAEALDKV